MDSYELTQVETSEQFVIGHITAIRRDPRYKNSTILWIPESNNATEAQRYTKVMKEYMSRQSHEERQKFKPLYMSSNPNTPGAYSSKGSKQQYAESLQTHLIFDSIDLDSALITGNPLIKEEGLQAYRDGLLFGLFTELDAFQSIKKSNNDIPTFTGKLGANGQPVSGKNDDKVITLMMATYFAREIHRNPELLKKC